MGLYGYCLGGSALIAIGIYESLASSLPHKNKAQVSTISSLSGTIISLSFIANSLISLRDSLQYHDPIGAAIQVEITSVAVLFLLHSLLPLLPLPLPLPRSLHRLTLFSAFAQELLHLYLHRKDPSGLENRYFDLCSSPSPSAPPPPSSAPAGRASRAGSGGSFTVKCKGHMDDHRAKAIATLQFNCHLALLLVGLLFVFSLVARLYGLSSSTQDYFHGTKNYTPLNAELADLRDQARFEFDDDDDDDDGDGEIVVDVEHDGVKMKSVGGVGGAPQLGVNGFGDHD
ncbi:hypothetical protein Sjap_015967 [Stephania japonica]|uniref:Uncharacterized protein n=1 Tax=Stephania japonica TaxID=461633 RepID=A0AAP0IKL0_9MAGN